MFTYDIFQHPASCATSRGYVSYVTLNSIVFPYKKEKEKEKEKRKEKKEKTLFSYYIYICKH